MAGRCVLDGDSTGASAARGRTVHHARTRKYEASPLPRPA